ncbi:trehalose 6-phosphate synthase [Natronoarchaeum philippinense]|uniref:Trehalose 6-phosphate synthase n=1 Tax=Natronoarchaeum philippinense TaxID=558529 RepID=A0A285NS08_NATPI|nr:trehalose-6-phosphate synthase [Natronoarchaeum philippinense]SNZ12265.1 trehalose 6-phosphate synthase [Natronoarchaeum philippinense]
MPSDERESDAPAPTERPGAERAGKPTRPPGWFDVTPSDDRSGGSGADSKAAATDAAASFLDGRRLVVMSNRQPYSHEYDGDEVVVNRPAGGLTAALDPVIQTVGGTWVAWGSGEADRVVADDDVVEVPPEDPAYDLRRVWLDEEQVDGYYYGYSNQALWPLSHSDTTRATFSRDDWKCYREVNELFAEAAVEACDDADPVIWFQDYHFGLAPQMARERLGEDAFLMQFWHLPWTGWDVFRACPQAEQLLDGLLANDLLGFHTAAYCQHFLDTVEATTDYDVDRGTRCVRQNDRRTYVRPFRIGIDADAQAAAADTDEAASFWETFADAHGLEDRRVGVGVDRLDYTKGIVERLEALEQFFETRPEWRGEFTFVQKGSESRSRIPAYRKVQERVEAKVADINSRFGTTDWQPIVYTTEMLSGEALAGLYRHADLCLVTSLRDGMNLVAKEFAAAQLDTTGVLVLSELAGASDELGDDAVLIHPSDTPAVADAIERALSMPADERERRMRGLREQVLDADVYEWIASQFRTAERIERPGPEQESAVDA